MESSHKKMHCRVSTGSLREPIEATVSRSVDAVALGRDSENHVLACVAEEEAVAFRYSGFGHAIMMATPADLEDFTLGFSLTEGVIGQRSDVIEVSIARAESGITVDVTLASRCLHGFLARRRVRQLRGSVSCGLCGVEDFDSVFRPATRVRQRDPPAREAIIAALEGLRTWQPLSRSTRCAHAAAWASPDGTLRVVREDVGRHNSLDKLIGARLQGDLCTSEGFGVVTSRCSFEMVQKAVAAGFPAIVFASAPTGLAVRAAEAAGLRLYAFSKERGPLRFTLTQDQDTQ